jgi:hypothetical protein
MRVISIECLAVGSVLLFCSAGFAADERLDLRLKQSTVSSRMSIPRLALGTVKEEAKDEQLAVKKKRAVAKRPPVSRVTKAERQRKRKTKRVVASQ